MIDKEEELDPLIEEIGQVLKNLENRQNEGIEFLTIYSSLFVACNAVITEDHNKCGTLIKMLQEFFMKELHGGRYNIH